jgi:hypothetical protein
MPTGHYKRLIRRLSPEEKRQIREIGIRGTPRAEIARQFDCHPSQVNGILNTAEKFGPLHRIPEGFTAAPEAAPPVSTPEPVQVIPEEPKPVHEEAPVTTRETQPQPQAYDPANYGFNFVAGGPGTFTNYTTQPVFRVERVQPAHGHLGTHIGSYDPEHLALTYGSGLYRITLRLPNNPKEFVGEYRVSDNYGQPKFPAREGEEGGRDERGQRPMQQRPPAPPWAGAHGPVDAYGRPYDWPPRMQQPVVVGEAAAAEAIRTMGKLQETFLARESEERKAGPGAFLQEIMREQDARAARTREDERVREETRRLNDEALRKKEKEERDEQWRRERLEAEDRHKRELEIVRENQTNQENREKSHHTFLLNLEKERIALIQKESDNREKAVKDELTRSRSDMASLEKAVSKQLDDGKKDIDKEFALRKEMLEKEHDLIESNMKREQELLHGQLELERTIAQANTTDSLVKGVHQLVSELRKGVDSILDHKKMEMGYVQGPGNVTTLPEKQAAEENPKAETVTQEAAPMQQQDFIGEFMKDPGGRQLVSEWSRQVAAQVPPGSFLGLFMDGYQDPLDHGFRKACRLFSVYIRSRDWTTMRAALVATKLLDADEQAAFESPWAEDFYEGFRLCFFEEIDAFWASVAQRRAERQPEAKVEPKAEEPVKEAKG